MKDAGGYPLNLGEDEVGQREGKQEGLGNAGRGTIAEEQSQSSYLLVEQRTRN